MLVTGFGYNKRRYVWNSVRVVFTENKTELDFSRFLEHEPRVLPYPYQSGLVGVEIPLGRICSHLMHNSLNHNYPFESYKYKLISIVEGEN